MQRLRVARSFALCLMCRLQIYEECKIQPPADRAFVPGHAVKYDGVIIVLSGAWLNFARFTQASFQVAVLCIGHYPRRIFLVGFCGFFYYYYFLVRKLTGCSLFDLGVKLRI